MKKFRCPDPAHGGEVLVHILDPLRCAPPDYREVEIILSDGRRFVAVVARDPQQRGGHWWEKPGAVMVQDVSTEQVLAAVQDILRRGPVDEAFEPMPED